MGRLRDSYRYCLTTARFVSLETVQSLDTGTTCTVRQRPEALKASDAALFVQF